MAKEPTKADRPLSERRAEEARQAAEIHAGVKRAHFQVGEQRMMEDMIAALPGL
jgi:hypothetical protein